MNTEPCSSLSSVDEDDEEQDDLMKEFEAASNHLRTLTDVADSNTLLYLYARYKQATDGPCQAPKPGLFDFRGKQKWETWKSLGDMDKSQAMLEYVKKIKEIDPKWSYGKTDGGERKREPKAGFGVGVSKPMLEDGDLEGGEEGLDWLDLVKAGNLEMLKALSKSDPTRLRIIDTDGMSALHWASDRGREDIMDWLLSQGLDPNIRDNNGQTPLHYAYACGHEKIINCLMKAGADKTILDNDGYKPEDLGELC